VIEEILFDVSEALKWPVLIAVLVALLAAIVEVGALLVEIVRRRHRSVWALERAVDLARAQLAANQRTEAVGSLLVVANSRAMEEAIGGIVEQLGRPDAEARISKRLAEYDYRSLRRLERTRILVRFGPALGLMGTLIPLSPALAGLADGDVDTLTENLRIAFGVTVAGLLVGAIAFTVSLIRDRLYAQDYSDVEYIAAALTTNAHLPVGQHSHWAVAP
jgi:biopolymer transport protein ExbB/TolQ